MFDDTYISVPIIEISAAISTRDRVKDLRQAVASVVNPTKLGIIWMIAASDTTDNLHEVRRHLSGGGGRGATAI